MKFSAFEPIGRLKTALRARFPNPRILMLAVMLEADEEDAVDACLLRGHW